MEDEEDTIKIKIMNLSLTIKGELNLINRDDSLVFLNNDSETIIETEKDLMNLIKVHFKVPYKKFKLITTNGSRINKNDEASTIISLLEYEDPGVIIIEDFEITLILKTNLNNNKKELIIESDATLLNLKQKIKDLINAEINDQKIIFNGKEITNNNKNLIEYGIDDDCTIQLEVKKKSYNDFLLQEYKNMDLEERKEFIINNASYELDKYKNINDKLNDQDILDLVCNPKYDDYFGVSRDFFLDYNKEQLEELKKEKILFDKNLDLITL